MSELLQVPTHFADIAQLSEGLADRIEDDRLILYGPQAYAEGERVPFAVYLLDGNPALEGTGQVAVAVDGGEERAAETRFDIVLEAIAYDARSEVIVESILLARGSQPAEAPAANLAGDDLAGDDLAGDDLAGDVAMDLEPAEEPPATEPEVPGLPAHTVEVGAAEPAARGPALSDGVLRRPMFPPAWAPVAAAAPAPAPSTGAFAYAAGPLPTPSAPPFPELGPEERVAPAPRPGEAMPTPSLVPVDAGLEATAPAEARASAGEPPREDPTPVDVDLEFGEAEDAP